MSKRVVPDYTVEENVFEGEDGTMIFYRVFRPNLIKRKPKVLVVHHGFGEHGGRYENLTEALKESGFIIYIHDARGHGRSGGKRGHVNNFLEFLDDLDRLIRIATKTEKVPKVYLMGHSMGGLVVLCYAAMGTNQGNLVTLIASGSALRVHLNVVMRVKKFVGQFLANVLPEVTVPAGLNIEDLSHDPEVIEAYKADPLVHGEISMALGKVFLEIGEPCINSADVIRVPTYLFHGQEDRIADPSGSIAFYNNLVIADRKLNIYENLFHETMNEYPKDRDRVLSDLRVWLEKH
ncbi:MAG: lysophospholipase [Leptospiraceae bacterium]|nr:alpha/beta hydrolase [Leptospiraceae bacterium]MCK6380348.1 lysophospholipase [Leptospiraceae bacterium]NUM40871.1 lysophospholipase [Leptospiraceae bacterium]